MLGAARHVHAQTGMKNLCLAGGVALNCVGNGRILREGPFENIWIQPAAGDAGGALGAALFRLASAARQAAHGRQPSDAHAAARCSARRSRSTTVAHVPRRGRRELHDAIRTTTRCATAVAELMAQEKVVGWFQGRMEFGPRALGARSILGDARSPRCSRR